MWKGTPGIDSLMRAALDRRRSKEDREEATASSESAEVPDLFANNDNLREITEVRDAVRGLRTEARAVDAESELSSRSCETDIRRYCVLVCGRIIGGQKRELT